MQDRHEREGLALGIRLAVLVLGEQTHDPLGERVAVRPRQTQAEPSEDDLVGVGGRALLAAPA